MVYTFIWQYKVQVILKVVKIHINLCGNHHIHFIKQNIEYKYNILLYHFVNVL